MFILDPDPDVDFLSIPDPGSRGQKGTESRIPDPQHWGEENIIFDIGGAVCKGATPSVEQ